MRHETDSMGKNAWMIGRVYIIAGQAGRDSRSRYPANQVVIVIQIITVFFLTCNYTYKSCFKVNNVYSLIFATDLNTKSDCVEFQCNQIFFIPYFSHIFPTAVKIRNNNVVFVIYSVRGNVVSMTTSSRILMSIWRRI